MIIPIVTEKPLARTRKGKGNRNKASGDNSPHDMCFSKDTVDDFGPNEDHGYHPVFEKILKAACEALHVDLNWEMRKVLHKPRMVLDFVGCHDCVELE